MNGVYNFFLNIIFVYKCDLFKLYKFNYRAKKRWPEFLKNIIIKSQQTIVIERSNASKLIIF